MMKFGAVALAFGAIALFGCSNNNSDSDASILPDGGGADAATGFQQPTGTVAVNFSVDDSANKVYKAADLQWKGEVKYDPATRLGTLDATWGGPFANMYDDGPWNVCSSSTSCGHEPLGSTAGDNKWGVAVFIKPPATGSDTYSYGLQDANAVSASCTTCVANGWSWNGANGSFVVAAGATQPINAAGQTFAKFGSTDLQVSVDPTLALSLCQFTAPVACVNNACPTDAGPAQACVNGMCQLATTVACTAGGAACPTGQSCVGPDTTKVTIKGSGWGWNEVPLTATAGIFTYQQSTFTGTGNDVPHSGLFNSGYNAEFVVVFNGVEYRDRTATGMGNCAQQGVIVKTGTGGALTTQTISVNAGGNTYVTIP